VAAVRFVLCGVELSIEFTPQKSASTKSRSEILGRPSSSQKNLAIVPPGTTSWIRTRIEGQVSLQEQQTIDIS
jgi:hypothetical protein